MIFELSYFAAQFDSSSIRFFSSFQPSTPSTPSITSFSSLFLFLYSQASVDLSIHLEQMDIRNGSTLSNVAFPFHQHIRLLAHSQRFYFFPTLFFLFRSHITVLDSASIHTQNTSKLCECCFQYEARFYCVSIASMNCDEMKAH